MVHEIGTALFCKNVKSFLVTQYQRYGKLIYTDKEQLKK